MFANAKIEEDYVVQAVEYAMNPYVTYNAIVGTNVFDVKIFNQSTLAEVDVVNSAMNFEFAFPFSENFNLTYFGEDYNSLSKYNQNDLQTKS